MKDPILTNQDKRRPKNLCSSLIEDWEDNEDWPVDRKGVGRRDEVDESKPKEPLRNRHRTLYELEMENVLYLCPYSGCLRKLSTWKGRQNHCCEKHKWSQITDFRFCRDRRRGEGSWGMIGVSMDTDKVNIKGFSKQILNCYSDKRCYIEVTTIIRPKMQIDSRYLYLFVVPLIKTNQKPYYLKTHDKVTL